MNIHPTQTAIEDLLPFDYGFVVDLKMKEVTLRHPFTTATTTLQADEGVSLFLNKKVLNGLGIRAHMSTYAQRSIRRSSSMTVY